MPDQLDRAIEQYEPQTTELDATLAGLTPEQDIRTYALNAAVRLIAGHLEDGIAIRDAEAIAIGTAGRFADWIATGDETAWKPPEMTDHICRPYTVPTDRMEDMEGKE